MYAIRSYYGTKQTNNLFVNVYQSSLAINLTSPTTQLIHQNEKITVSAESSVEAELALKLDETTLATTTGSSISTTATFSETGWKWLIASATADGTTAYDSLHVRITSYNVCYTKLLRKHC